VGGTFGHCLCTGLAVIGGRMIAQKISVRTGEMFFISLLHLYLAVGVNAAELRGKISNKVIYPLCCVT